MKTIQPHLCRSARSLRLSRPSKSFKFAPPQAGFSSVGRLSRTVAGFIYKDDDTNMAPKGQKFELKTPKGTKDCECAFLVVPIVFIYSRTSRGGEGHGDSGQDLFYNH